MQFRMPWLSTVFGVATLLSSCIGDAGTDSEQAFTNSDPPVEAATAALELAGQVCMQDNTPFDLNCTANDVQLADVTNIVILDDGCASVGDEVTFTADYEILLTAQARWDIGIYLAEDGGDALTGTCSIFTLPTDITDLDGDACGDIDDDPNPIMVMGLEVTATCIDPDEDGKLNLPNCSSWRTMGNEEVCNSPLDAFPGTPAKCRCDSEFEIDIPVPTDPCEGVDCSGLDDECNVGVCNPDLPGSGMELCEASPTNENGACDDELFCTTGEVCVAGVCTGTPDSTDCSAEDDQCNVGVCDETNDLCVAHPTNENEACDDELFCTTGEVCVAGACTGTPDSTDCGDMVDCTDDSCDEESDECVNDPTSDCATCRSPGFWGTHPLETNTVLMDNPDEVITVCGVEVDMYDPCAVEGLCNRPKGDIQLITARHVLATALNCRLSLTDDCSDPDIGDIQYAFDACNAACDCGDEPCSDEAIDTMKSCYPQLDCFNNGGVSDDHIGCAFGRCSDDYDDLCNTDEDCTPYYDTDGYNTNVCVLFVGCHDNLLDVTGILSEPPTNAEPAMCRAAKKSQDTLFDACMPSMP